MSEVLFLVVGLLLGYLSQFLLDRIAAKRSAAAQLRQERQKAHVAFHTEVNKFLRDISYVQNRGVDEGEKQHREFIYNSRPLLDLLPAVELLAEPATYKAAVKVAEACERYKEYSAPGHGMALQENVQEYLAAVRKELGFEKAAESLEAEKPEQDALGGATGSER